MSPAGKHPHAIELRRIGIDTDQHAVISMRSDCYVCRSEGFEAETHGFVRNGTRGILATTNVVTSGLLDPGETATRDGTQDVERGRYSDIRWLVTVDPHLHRYPSLTTIDPIETDVVAVLAAPARMRLAHESPGMEY